MARIITCNTNGIRAAARKGFFDWLQGQQALSQLVLPREPQHTVWAGRPVNSSWYD